jgi:hypothetical protein
MDDEEVIGGIRERMARCRRLADQMTDEYARQELLNLAEEGDADIRRITQERQRLP